MWEWQITIIHELVINQKPNCVRSCASMDENLGRVLIIFTLLDERPLMKYITNEKRVGASRKSDESLTLLEMIINHNQSSHEPNMRIFDEHVHPWN